ncbi:hypothetical protein C8J56DRAFT_141824 [Mycena floridula]|nr:hypothetical protein C8J56DRAFT_141824 [Mycena floridula]
MSLVDTGVTDLNTFLPLVIETFLYGTYSVLFFVCTHILRKHKRPCHRIHLFSIAFLYLLSSIHMILEYVLVSKRPFNALQAYLLLVGFTQSNGKGERAMFVTQIVLAFAINLTADAILIYRCYAIWGCNRRVIIAPILGSLSTTVAIVFQFWGFKDDKAAGNFGAMLLAVMTLATNVLVISLTAGRIWWISHRMASYLPKDVQQRSKTAISVLLESGMLYPLSILANFIIIFAYNPNILSTHEYNKNTFWAMPFVYQSVGIAPTLMLVRVGLGWSTEDPISSSSSRRTKTHLPAFTPENTAHRFQCESDLYSTEENHLHEDLEAQARRK